MTPADLCLVLLLDASQSMSAEEWALQAGATAAALRHPEIVERIATGATGRVHVLVAEWSSGQHVLLPWTAIGGQADADAVAAQIAGWVRRQSAFTRLGDALAFARDRLGEAPDCGRRVVDVSTDGKSNQGPEPGPIVDALSRDGIEVNALVIEGEAGVVDYYKATVPGFVMVAQWESYAEAIRAKLSLEISGVSPDLWKRAFPLDQAFGLRSSCGPWSTPGCARQGGVGVVYQPWDLGWPAPPDGPLPFHPDLTLAESVPSPGALGLLALGLFGLAAWRGWR